MTSGNEIMATALMIPNPISSVDEITGAPWGQSIVQTSETKSFEIIIVNAITATPTNGSNTVTFSSYGGLTFYVLPGLFGFPMPNALRIEFTNFGSMNPNINVDNPAISMFYGFKPYKWSYSIKFSSFSKSDATTTSAEVWVNGSVESSITSLGLMVAFTFPSSATLSTGSWKTAGSYAISAKIEITCP